jgi:hypothetical protein
MKAMPTKVTKQITGSIVDAMDGVFADYFQGPSWSRWRAILKAAYALPMTGEERDLFYEVAEREPPTKRVKELWVIGGRRGGKDSIASLIIAHAAAQEIASSNTESVVAEFSALLKSYGITTVLADRYGQSWVVDAFARYGIELRHSPYDRSSLYLNLIPAMTSGQIRLLDIPRLRSQFLGLERRILRGSGKDVVDHRSGGADDMANAASGSLVMAAEAERRQIRWAFIGEHTFMGYDGKIHQNQPYESSTKVAEMMRNERRRAILGENWQSKINGPM